MLKALPSHACWQRAQLPLLVEAMSGGQSPAAPSADENLSEWVEAACGHCHMESEPVRTAVKDVEAALEHAAPALLVLPDGSFAGLIQVRRGMAHLITASLRCVYVPLAFLRDTLCAPAEDRYASETDGLLAECRPCLPSFHRARRALLRERAASNAVFLGWQMRVPPGSSFARQAVQAGLRRRLLVYAAAYSGEYALSLAAWWLLAEAALSGRFDAAWMLAWVAMMTCALLCRFAKASAGEAAAVGLGGLLKQRLIAGAIRLDPNSVRHEGAGGMLARVIDSEALESLALAGGLASLVAPLELVAACALLWLGAGGAPHAALLSGWVAALGALVWRDLHRRSAWTTARLAMTRDLVESMSGHRTRQTQEHPSHWNDGEDGALAGYLARAEELDRSQARLNTLLPRLWLLIGLAFLAPAFLHSASPASLGASIAAVLMAQRALRTLTAGLGSLEGAWLAWRQIGPLFRAAARTPEPGAPAAPGRNNAGKVLEARDLAYRYRGRGEPVLRGCSLTMHRGDWVMLEGASGNGKSTLAGLLAGLREPESGLLLAGGCDRTTLGEVRWRRRIAYAPQAHENHIFAGSLAFNLLMGRAWPPSWEDLSDAQGVCRDLGLSDLLARMPAGLDQIVGETGWQLSEGERSRIYLGRAILSGASLLVLDESLAGLDPDSLLCAFSALRNRAETVLMVAHP